MQTTSHTARLAALSNALQEAYALVKSYSRLQLEGREGYNPHESKHEMISDELMQCMRDDRDERAANLSADATTAIRVWINSQGFKSASQADSALRDAKGITLDGLKAAMARNNIV
jgi:hypothetical protein